MLGRVNFEGLFPELWKSIETPIARWEDDGGRHGEADGLSSFEESNVHLGDTLIAE